MKTKDKSFTIVALEVTLIVLLILSVRLYDGYREQQKVIGRSLYFTVEAAIDDLGEIKSLIDNRLKEDGDTDLEAPKFKLGDHLYLLDRVEFSDIYNTFDRYSARGKIWSSIQFDIIYQLNNVTWDKKLSSRDRQFLELSSKALYKVRSTYYRQRSNHGDYGYDDKAKYAGDYLVLMKELNKLIEEEEFKKLDDFFDKASENYEEDNKEYINEIKGEIKDRLSGIIPIESMEFDKVYSENMVFKIDSEMSPLFNRQYKVSYDTRDKSISLDILSRLVNDKSSEEVVDNRIGQVIDSLGINDYVLYDKDVDDENVVTVKLVPYEDGVYDELRRVTFSVYGDGIIKRLYIMGVNENPNFENPTYRVEELKEKYIDDIVLDIILVNSHKDELEYRVLVETKDNDDIMVYVHDVVDGEYKSKHLLRDDYSSVLNCYSY